MPSTPGCSGTYPGSAGAPLLTPEPQPIKPEQPSRFERLCSRALAENLISEAKVAELLGVSVRDLSERMA